MPEDWAGIAAEVRSAITDVGFVVYLRKPGVSTGPEYDRTLTDPTHYQLEAIQSSHRMADRAGTIVGASFRTLTLSVNPETPSGGWADGFVQTGIASNIRPQKQDDVFIDGKWLNVLDVRPLAPANQAVLYYVDLAL